MKVIPKAFRRCCACGSNEVRILALRPEPRPARFGKVHVIPVPASKRSRRAAWPRRAYRVFEIALALIGLIVAAAADAGGSGPDSARLSGTGAIPAQTARASVRMRGRDLEGRTDLVPPPGGYDRDA